MGTEVCGDGVSTSGSNPETSVGWGWVVVGGGAGSAPVLALIAFKLPHVKEIRHNSVASLLWRKQRAFFTAWTGVNVSQLLASRTGEMEARREKSPSVSPKKIKKSVRTRKRGANAQEGGCHPRVLIQESSLKTEIQTFPSILR